MNYTPTPCTLCGKRRPVKTDGASLGIPGPLCEPCYQKNWKKLRHPGRCQAAEQMVAVMETALREIALRHDPEFSAIAREALAEVEAIRSRMRRAATERAWRREAAA